MKPSFNNLKMRNKFILAFIISALIPQLILGIILFINLRSIVLENAIQDTKRNVYDVKDRVTEIAKIAVDISNKLYLDSKLLDILSTDYKDVAQIFEDYTSYNEISNLLQIYPDKIQAIKIYAYNKTLLDTGEFIKIDEHIKNEPWFSEAVKKDGRIVWTLVKEDNPLRANYYLSLVRLLKDSYGERMGVIVIFIRKNELRDILSSHIDTVITTNNGTIVAATDDQMMGKKINVRTSSGSDDLIKDVYINGKRFTAIIGTISLTFNDDNNFNVISFFPKKEIYSKVNRISLFSFAVILANLSISLTLMLIFAKLITDRVSVLNQKVKQISRGDLDVQISILGKDEIGELSENVGIMAKNIKNLIEQVYIANLQKQELLTRQKEIQLEVLCNQINPHFLFNTLEALRMRAVCNDQFEIAQVVYMLSNLLRKSINMTTELITIEKEVELVKDYLEIQRFRFGDKLSYTIDVDEVLFNAKILPFTLQPIVENSIRHGIEKMVGKGIIKIGVTEENGFISIVVSDNGLGMSEQKLNDLLNFIEIPTNGVHVGLKNVYQRLRLFYGDEAKMFIQSQRGIGTHVKIIIPKR